MIVLGIETSCDETAAAVIRRHADGRGEVLSNVVRSQWEAHAPYGGVVPEIAARAHVACIDDIVQAALRDAGIRPRDLDRVAATAGPGLIGGLLVGLTYAKGLALSTGVPLDPINHLEGHALTVGLTDGVKPPYLLLLVSGGHTQLIAVHDVGRYERLGTTVDDALGEAFDKTAKLLGLGAPGGPAVERAALEGDPASIALPRPMLGRPEPNFSFAGLKTAVRAAAEARAPARSADDRPRVLDPRDVADICASFQAAVADAVVDRTRMAMGRVAETMPSRALVIAGGVAANKTLRTALGDMAMEEGWTLTAPPLALCSDNAAMIAWTAAERAAHNVGGDARVAGSNDQTGDAAARGTPQHAALAAAARSRWPL
ncbi:MAG: tRNA (adenosine(37)-N6)-threonylcarbamoyltransferase complex transferase subunit TsaD, partial [Pseudomonadota bacterium]